RRSADRGLAGRDQSRWAPHHGRHLERRDRVIGDAVSRADDELVGLARTPGDAEARAKRQIVVGVVKALALAICNPTLRAVNWLVGDVDAFGRFLRRRVQFHSHAVADRQVLTQLPLVLRVSVVLFQTRADVEERYFAVFDERQERVAVYIANE